MLFATLRRDTMRRCNASPSCYFYLLCCFEVSTNNGKSVCSLFRPSRRTFLLRFFFPPSRRRCCRRLHLCLARLLRILILLFVSFLPLLDSPTPRSLASHSIANSITCRASTALDGKTLREMHIFVSSGQRLPSGAEHRTSSTWRGARSRKAVRQRTSRLLSPEARDVFMELQMKS